MAWRIVFSHLNDAVDMEDYLVNVALGGPSAAVLLHVDQHRVRLVVDVDRRRRLGRRAQPQMHPDSALWGLVVVGHLAGS